MDSFVSLWTYCSWVALSFACVRVVCVVCLIWSCCLNAGRRDVIKGEFLKLSVTKKTTKKKERKEIDQKRNAMKRRKRETVNNRKRSETPTEEN